MTVYRALGLKLVIDTRDDATPAMVYDHAERYSATWDCATGSGELMGRNDCMNLSRAQIEWLDKFDVKVSEAYDIARKDWQ